MYKLNIDKNETFHCRLLSRYLQDYLLFQGAVVYDGLQNKLV